MQCKGYIRSDFAKKSPQSSFAESSKLLIFVHLSFSSILEAPAFTNLMVYAVCFEIKPNTNPEAKEGHFLIHKTKKEQRLRIICRNC